MPKTAKPPKTAKTNTPKTAKPNTLKTAKPPKTKTAKSLNPPIRAICICATSCEITSQPIQPDLKTFLGPEHQVLVNLENNDVLFGNPTLFERSFLDATFRPNGFILQDINGFIGDGFILHRRADGTYRSPRSDVKDIKRAVKFVPYDDALLVHVFG